jgi:hypothetical protein
MKVLDERVTAEPGFGKMWRSQTEEGNFCDFAPVSNLIENCPQALTPN